MKDEMTQNNANQQSRQTVSFPFYQNHYCVEKKLLAFMALGYPDLLASYMEYNSKQYSSSHIPLTQAKYQGMSFAALAFRTAISAGISEQTAGTIQNDILRKFDTMNSSEQYWEITGETLLQFSIAISTEKLSGYSDAVRQCCEYLHRNLLNNISLDELGQICHLSPHYVSDLFRKEVGVGALQYFHQAKRHSFP